jgi:hypothetical protein
MKLRLPLNAPGVNVHDAETWPEVHVCESDPKCHEPRFATRRVHWVTGPIEYCDPCAAQMLRVAEVLGTHVHVEELPLGAMVRRLAGKEDA